MSENLFFLIVIAAYNALMITVSLIVKKKKKVISKGLMETLVFSFIMYFNWLCLILIQYDRDYFILGIAICWLLSYLICWVFMKTK